MEKKRLSTPLRELGLLRPSTAERLHPDGAESFNSPEGIRIIETYERDSTNIPRSLTFNSPEGIRIIETEDWWQNVAGKSWTFNSPEGIRIIETWRKGEVDARATAIFQLP